MKRELNLRQQKAMDYLLRHVKITNMGYRELNPEIKKSAAFNELKDLVDKGLISLKVKDDTHIMFYLKIKLMVLSGC
jgi:ATP-dependent DNA helicase RecG